MAVFEAEDIMRILPHRYPMLLVDRVLECDMKERIVAIKNLTINEPFFVGHFPNKPIMPGVLQLEAMAQTAGVLLNRYFQRDGREAYYLSVDGARFRKMLRPGDQMVMEVVLTKARRTMFKLHGTIKVDGELACEADMMFGVLDED